jgi:hypothetical protein
MNRETAFTILSGVIYAVIGVSIGVLIEGFIRGDLRCIAMAALVLS